MTAAAGATTSNKEAPQGRVVLHPLPVRLAHWTFALGTILLIGSGWRIHNQSDWFTWVQFPIWMTIGGSREGSFRVHDDLGLAGALLWHFFAMWLLFASLVLYVVWGVATGHFRRRFWPVSVSDAVSNVGDFFRGRLGHHLGARNSVQKLLYAGSVLLMVLMIWSGLAIWKPATLSWFAWPLGGYVGARVIHILGMAAMVAFLGVHVLLVFLVPKVLPPMLTGTVPADHLAQEGRP